MPHTESGKRVGRPVLRRESEMKVLRTVHCDGDVGLQGGVVVFPANVQTLVFHSHIPDGQVTITLVHRGPLVQVSFNFTTPGCCLGLRGRKTKRK